MPITAAIIVVLFAFQRVGTAAVGRLFGPVMIIWFVIIGACGIAGIVDQSEILRALHHGGHEVGHVVAHNRTIAGHRSPRLAELGKRPRHGSVGVAV